MRTINHFKAGVFVLVSLTVLLIAVWVMGTEREIFSSQKEFFASFSDVKGLNPGAPVRLGGLTIGRVDEIRFTEDPSNTNVNVAILVNERYLNRVRADARVSLETQGLLGDRFLNISVGRSPQELPPGSAIEPVEASEITDVLSKAGTIVDNTVEISENLKVVSDNLKTNASSDLSEGMKNLNEVAKNINEITKQIRSGKGLAHSVIYDSSGSSTVSAFTEAATNLAKTAADIGELVTQVKGGKGAMHDLLYNESSDAQGLSDVIKQLNDTAENLRAASSALKDGSGTIGALLVDSKLYDNLVEVTEGAKRSFILREAVRSSLNN